MIRYDVKDSCIKHDYCVLFHSSFFVVVWSVAFQAADGTIHPRTTSKLLSLQDAAIRNGKRLDFLQKALIGSSYCIISPLPQTL